MIIGTYLCLWHSSKGHFLGNIEKMRIFGHFLAVFTPNLCKCALNYLNFSEKLLPNEFYTICKNNYHSAFFALVAPLFENFLSSQVKDNAMAKT